MSAQASMFAWRHNPGTCAAKLVLLYLADNTADEEHRTLTSDARIQGATGLDRNAVTAGLRLLMDQGVLVVEEASYKGTSETLYRLTIGADGGRQ